ncbi:hypothetical protein PV04_04350 [Phialophora macrospora]|uniref:Zn(2)-C6 fungal-type domain-containing protein n=1 Tax=Phialophora macrospora TaxID=1851006 RepID=A0A0D2G915_9EURO|nr:hypothetical protein PV04_04350 [Phialophora macrospora]
MTSILSAPGHHHFPDNNAAAAAAYRSPDGVNVPRSILPHPDKASSPPTLKAGGTPRRNAKRPRTNVTVACDGCKLARAKCDGKLPCTRCVKKDVLCTYEQGIDRRQSRGSHDEVQALTERLSQYQTFVFALRSASPGNAGYALHRLRSLPTESSPYAAEGMAVAAPVQPFDDVSSSVGLVCMDLDETATLVEWVKRDMDSTLATAKRSFLSQSPCQSKSQPQQRLPDERDRNGLAARHLTTRTIFSVKGLLCSGSHELPNASSPGRDRLETMHCARSFAAD